MEVLLRKMQLQQKGKISKILARNELGRKIRDLGLTPETEIKIISKAPFKNPVAIKVRDTVLALRNSEADTFYVITK